MRDTTDMVNEVGLEWLTHNWLYKDHLQRFAELVRADEREACAEVCDDLAGMLACHNDRDGADICVSLRDTIRARGETK